MSAPVVTCDSRWQSVLGEGLCYQASTGAFWWVDILSKTLFTADKQNIFRQYSLPEMASKVLAVTGAVVTLATESGIAEFNVGNGEWRVISPTPPWTLGGEFRANDGVDIGDGISVYGRMRKMPAAGCGDLVLVTPGGSTVIHSGIAIPNTFVWFADERVLLVSDSLVKKTYALNFDRSLSRVASTSLWHDFAAHSGTPDGAYLSARGHIYLAMWGGACVLTMNRHGKILDEISLPVLQPTSCWVSDDEHELIVTSATEGMSVDEIKRYPLSGQVLRLSMAGGAA